MIKKRKQYSPEFKAKVGLAADHPSITSHGRFIRRTFR